MKIMIIVGARPNFMKAGPILKAIAEHNQRGQEPAVERVLVHTGQHYDSRMSDAFFADLDMPQPDVFLGAGSGSHAVQTAEIMKRFEEVVVREWPDVVVVLGDVNSTTACALVTSKLTSPEGKERPLVAHVEAGLRSGDRSMPEEINRIITDHLSDLLFITEESGLKNLEREGISQDQIFFVGNTMIDSLMAYRAKADQSTVLQRVGVRPEGNGAGQPYVLLTLHRPANVDNPESLLEILEGLKDLVASYPIVFPAHPRTQKQIQQFGFNQYFNFAGEGKPAKAGASRGITLIEPQGYLDFLCLMKNARLVVTDSGGIQEETTGSRRALRYGARQHRAPGDGGGRQQCSGGHEPRRHPAGHSPPIEPRAKKCRSLSLGRQGCAPHSGNSAASEPSSGCLRHRSARRHDPLKSLAADERKHTN